MAAPLCAWALRSTLAGGHVGGEDTERLGEVQAEGAWAKLYTAHPSPSMYQNSHLSH